MGSILNDERNAQRLLKMTAGTLILLDESGNCIDIQVQDEGLWFLNEKLLKGQNLFSLFPQETYRQLYPNFRDVLTRKCVSSQSYEMKLNDQTYYFRCTMQPYDNLVLCQYKDITESSIQRREILKRNKELDEIQKIVLLSHWRYESRSNEMYFSGSTGIFTDITNCSLDADILRQHIVQEDLESYDRWTERLLKGDLSDTFTYRVKHHDKIHHIRSKCFSREKFKDGHIILEGYVQNITEIQQNRNDINLLTDAINNASGSVFAADEEGHLIFTNRRYREQHHIKDKEAYSQLKVYEINSYFKDKEDWDNYVENVKQGHRSQHFTTYHPFPLCPEIIAIESYAHWITDDNGKGTIWTFGRDITQRIVAEQKLKHFNLIMNKSLEKLPASVVVKDINDGFKYVYRNREYFNRIIYQEDPIGKDDFYFHSYEDALRKREEDTQIAQSGIEKHWVVEDKDGDGNTVYIDKRKLKIEEEGLPPLLLSIDWDITDMEKMKRELIEAKEKAETSDRLKSAFLANMSHEIRTPLNAIVGFSRIIAETEDADERNEYYSIVEENNERLLKLINEILDLSKIEADMVELSIRPISMQALCTEIGQTFQFRCGEQVQLVFDPSDPSLLAMADNSRVFQIVSNLINNSLKFTPQGAIHYGYRQKDHFIEVYVRDTGGGIPEEKLRKIFDRFVKGNEMAQGSGLGLAICKMLVEKMGGQIQVTSEVGKGSTFSFTLPEA